MVGERMEGLWLGTVQERCVLSRKNNERNIALRGSEFEGEAWCEGWDLALREEWVLQLRPLVRHRFEERCTSNERL